MTLPLAAHLRQVKVIDARQRARVKELVAGWKKQGCQLCPEAEICCLSAHHASHLGDKSFAIAEAANKGYALSIIEAELAKCVCLCENCHGKVHARVLQL